MAKQSIPDTKATTEHRRSVERSNAYPAFSIDYAFDLTRKIYLQFGSSGHNTRETIAKVLKMSPNYLIIPLSTASQYGLLEMKTKMGYNPTPLFVKLYKPEDDAEKRGAQLECIKNPKLYNALLEAYKGNILPTAHALATTLFRRYSIAENASLKAAEIFIENLKSLSLLDDENKLIDVDQANTSQEVNQPLPSDNRNGSSFDNIQSNVGMGFSRPTSSSSAALSMDIKLNDGRKATLIYPENIVDSDWNRIVRVINAMKENED